MKKIFISILSILAFVACNVSPLDEPEAKEVQFTFEAYNDDYPSSKTVLVENGKVFWNVGDEISVFYGPGEAGGSKFTSNNTTPAAKTSFSGSINIISAGMEEEYENSKFLGVYPYSSGNSSDGNTLSVHISDTMTAIEGSFPSGNMVSVARSNGLALAFYNVCGGIKFTVQEEGIMKVILEGNNAETLAGDATISFGANGKPIVSSVSDPKQKLNFYAPTSDGFEPGKSYYFPFLPTQFVSGMSFTLLKNNAKGIKTYSQPATIERSVFGSINLLDKDVVFEDWDNPEAETDPTRIVLHYNAPNDETVVSFSYHPGGSYRPGEWVSELVIDGTIVSPGEKYNLGKAGDHKVMMNFVDNEIPDAFFRNAYLTEPFLTSVSIPEGYTNIPRECFNNCTSLKKVFLPESLISISDISFKNCSGLETLYIPESVNSVYYSAFWGCDNLKSFTGTNVIDNGHLLVDSDNNPLAFAPCGYNWSLASAGMYGILKNYIPPTGVDTGYTPYGAEYKCFSNDYLGDGYIIRAAAPTLQWLAITNAKTPFDNYLQDYTALKYLSLNCEYYPYTGITKGTDSAVMGNLIFCCDALLQVDFCTGVKKISNCCVNCKSLSRITFSEGLTDVGGRSFVNLPSLVEIRFPDSVKSIGDWCFSQTEALKRVYFGKNLEYIGDGLFSHLGLWECVLEEIYFASTTPPGGYVPTNIPSTCRILVPTDSVDEYKSRWELLSDQIEAYDFGEDYFHF